MLRSSLWVAALVAAVGCGDPGCPEGSVMLEDGRCVLPEDGGGADAGTDAGESVDAGTDVGEAPDTGILCEAGTGNCDGDPSNGCEQDLTDRTHCGACGVICAPHETCDGTCVPQVTFEWSVPVRGVRATTLGVGTDERGGVLTGGSVVGDFDFGEMSVEADGLSVWLAHLVSPSDISFVAALTGSGSPQPLGFTAARELALISGEFTGTVGTASPITSEGGEDGFAAVYNRLGALPTFRAGGSMDDRIAHPAVVRAGTTVGLGGVGVAGSRFTIGEGGPTVDAGPFAFGFEWADQPLTSGAFTGAAGLGEELVVTGYSDERIDFLSGTDPQLEDGFVAQYRPDGTQRWLSRITTAGNDRIETLSWDDDVGIVVTGHVEQRGAVTFGELEFAAERPDSLFVARLGSDGVVDWASTFGPHIRLSAAVGGLDSIYLVGAIEEPVDYGLGRIVPEGRGDGVVVALDLSGAVRWVLVVGGSGRATVTSLDTFRSTADERFLYIGGEYDGEVRLGEETHVSGGDAPNAFVAALRLP